MQLYHGSTAVVSTCFGLTETFDTTSGILQGGTLSPHLFILLVDYILRQSLVDEDGFTLKPANGRRHPVVTLTALAYADDVAVTCDSTSGAESTLRRLQFHSEAIGLKLNAAKVLHVGYESDPLPILTLDGTTIDVCDIYSYFGLPTLSSKVVICQRFTAAWSAIGKLRPMFDGTTIDVCDIYSYFGLPTLSSKVVICQRFTAAWSAIGKLRPMFDGTTIDVCDIYSYFGLPTLSSKVVICQRFTAAWSAIGRLRPMFDGTTIDVCDIYSYFGLPTLSSKVVICQRFTAAWSAIGKLRPMFHSMAPDALKITLYKSAVKIIAAYPLESLPLNPTTSNMLDAGHRQLLRAALGINWRSNITNEEVYAKSGLLLFSQTIRKRRLHLIGHLLRLQHRSATPLGQCCMTLTSYSRYAVDRAERGLWRMICSTI